MNDERFPENFQFSAGNDHEYAPEYKSEFHWSQMQMRRRERERRGRAETEVRLKLARDN